MRLLATLALLYVPVTSFSQEPVTLKNFEAALEKLRAQAKAAVQRIESQAEVQLKDVAATFEKEAEAIRKDFLARLEDFQVESTKAGDLDSALTARDEKQKLAAMKLALAEQGEQRLAETNKSRLRNQSEEKEKPLTAKDFIGVWVNEGLKQVVFNTDGTYGPGNPKTQRWSYDAKSKKFRDWNGTLAWEYTVYANGMFMEGFQIERNGQKGRRVWLARIR